ncbi:hypothetical protein J4211_01155 [Candidatus Woesearchaeota archaeon]|nr:hypothetical protein [Candidatus Woesearchaeota archaeon]
MESNEYEEKLRLLVKSLDDKIESERKEESAPYGGRFVQAYDNLPKIKNAARVETYQSVREQIYQLFPDLQK